MPWIISLETNGLLWQTTWRKDRMIFLLKLKKRKYAKSFPFGRKPLSGVIMIRYSRVFVGLPRLPIISHHQNLFRRCSALTIAKIPSDAIWKKQIRSAKHL